MSSSHDKRIVNWQACRVNALKTNSHMAISQKCISIVMQNTDKFVFTFYLHLIQAVMITV